MGSVIKAKNTPPIFKDISGTEAAKLILASPFESYDVVGFDVLEANRLNVKHNTLVSIAPEDTGVFLRPETWIIPKLDHGLQDEPSQPSENLYA